MRTVCIGSVFVSDLVVGCHEEDHASEQQAQVGRLVHPAGTHLHLGGRQMPPVEFPHLGLKGNWHVERAGRGLVVCPSTV